MCKRLLLAVMLAAVLVMPVFADITAESKCDVETLGVPEGIVNLSAIWNPKNFTCNQGYYLKAETEDCTICPQGSYCEGIEEVEYDGENHGIEACQNGWTSDQGTVSETECYQVNIVMCSEHNPYTYGHGSAVYSNENTSCKIYYGTEDCIVENEQECNIISLNCESGYRQETVDGVLQCVPAGINCSVGTYLKQNTTTCSVCPKDAYCSGGVYEAPALEDQGVVGCAPGLKAPAGSRSENDCGRVLHVGDGILHLHKDKRTEHSLVVKVDGIKYYADTTPISEGVKTINPDSSETLRIKIDGVEYSVHETIYE